MATRPPRIAIANDYELVVRGLATVLEPYADQVRVVELDARMPVASDVDLVLYDTFGQVQGLGIDINQVVGGSGARVVIFSWNTDPVLIDRALGAGAAGYISKTVVAQDLVALLLRIHAGECVVHVSAGVPGDVGERFGSWPGELQGLSPRESEVLALVCQGLSNTEITQRAFIAMNTVKTHIRSAYRKIGVTTRAQAVGWGLTHGFSPNPTRELRHL